MFTDLGAQQMLKSYFNKTQPVAGNDLTLRLFVNDITPASDDVAGDYAEPVGAGYAALPLVAGHWVPSIVDGVAQVTYDAPKNFVFSGVIPDTPDVLGYFVTDADGILVWAVREATAFTPAVAGDLTSVTPVYKLGNGTPTATGI